MATPELSFCKCTWLFRYAGWPLPVNIMYSSINSKIWPLLVTTTCYLLWWRIMYWYHGGCLSDVSTLLTTARIPSCSRGRNDAVWSSSSFAQDEANCSTRTWTHKSVHRTIIYSFSLGRIFKQCAVLGTKKLSIWSLVCLFACAHILLALY